MTPLTGANVMSAVPSANYRQELKGLTTADAERRLREVGPNTTPEESLHSIRLIASKFLAPVPGLLEAAIVLQVTLGEYVEASIVGLLLVVNAGIGFLHESRAQWTIAAPVDHIRAPHARARARRRRLQVENPF